LIVTTSVVLECGQITHAQNESTVTNRSRKKVLGLEKVIVFYRAYPELESQTFARGGEWKYWKDRGEVVSRGVVHYKFLDCQANVSAAGLAPRSWKLKHRDPKYSTSQILASTGTRTSPHFSPNGEAVTVC